MAVDSSANIGIRVFLDDAASRGLYAINTTLGQIGTQAKVAGAGFKEAGDSMAGLSIVAGLAASFIAFAGGLAYASAQGAGIALQLTKIGLATDLTQAQLAKLQPFLLNLGGTSIFSLQQLADGMAVLGQYSFKTLQQIEALSAAGVKLAEATGVQPVDAFKLLAVTMQAFKIPADQANYAASLLFYSFEHGTPSVSAMITAIGQLGGAATNLHIPLSDIIPALDTITIGVGSVSTAAAGLRYFLTNITFGTSAARAEMVKLGISVYDAQGRFIGLPATLSTIAAKLKGMTDQEKAAALGTLFNIRSGTAVKQLLDQLDAYSARLKQVSSAQLLQQQLDAAVAAVMSNLGNVAKEVGSNFQDFAGEVGLQVIPILVGFLQNVVLPLVTAIRLWAADPAHARLVAQFLAVGAAISAAGLIIVAVLTPVGQFVLIVLAVVAAISLLSAFIVAVINHWRQIQGVLAAVAPIAKTVGAVLLTIGAVIAGMVLAPWVTALLGAGAALLYLGVAGAVHAIPTLLGLAQGFIQATAKTLAYVAMNIGTLIPTILRTAAAWAVEALATMAAMLPYILIAAVIAAAVIGLGLLIAKLGLLNVIVSIAKNAWNAILPALQSVAAMLKDAFVAAIKQLQPVWQQLVAAFNAAKPVLMFLGGILGAILVVALSILVGAIRAVIVIVGTLLAAVIRVAAGIFQAIAGIVQFFLGFFKLLQGIFTGNTKLIQQGWNTMMTGLKNIVMGIGSAIINAFKGLWDAVIGGVKNFIAGVINFFKGLWHSLVGNSIVWDIVNGTIGAFASMPGKVISIILGWIGQMLSNVGSLVGRMISALGIGNFIGVFTRLPGQILGALGNLAGDLFNFGAHIIQMFINGIGSALGGLWNTVSNIAGGIAKFLGFSGPPPLGPLHVSDQWMPHMMEMLAATAQAHMPTISKMGTNIAQGIAASSSTIHPVSAASGTGGGQASTQFIINLDSKVIYNSMMSRMRNGLQAQGTARLLR